MLQGDKHGPVSIIQIFAAAFNDGFARRCGDMDRHVSKEEVASSCAWRVCS
jgi:hypothetical protein